MGRDFSGVGRVREMGDNARTVLQSLNYDPDEMPPRLREDETISPIAYWAYRVREAAKRVDRSYKLASEHTQESYNVALINVLETGQCYGILLAQSGNEVNRDKGPKTRREQREQRKEMLRKLAEQKYPSADHPRPLTVEQRDRLRIAFAQRHPHDKVSPKRFSGWCQDIGLQAPRKPREKTI